MIRYSGLGPRWGAAPKPQPTTDAGIRAILVVDDSAAIRELLQMALRAGGFEVIATADGAAAMAFLRESRVDLVITDINMPHMDGLDLIERIRREPRHSATPILVLSSESSPARRERAAVAGVNAWMSKPFSAARLMGAIGRLEAAQGLPNR
jgi:two-component system chemotaxis response regulator CheY